MKNRILAGIGALALIVVAVVVRGLVAGDDASGGGGKSSGKTPVVGCAPEVEAVCTALAREGVIAAVSPTFGFDDPMATTQRTESGQKIDGWIALDPSGNLVNDRDQQYWGAGTALGSSPIAVAFKGSIPPGCQPTFTWDCLLGKDDDGKDIRVAMNETHDDVDALLRAYPWVQTATDGDFEDLPSAVRQAKDSTNSNSREFGVDAKNAKIPGRFNAIVGPLAGLNGLHGATPFTIVSNVPSTIDYTVTAYPRVGTDDAWIQQIPGAPGVEEALAAIGVGPAQGVKLIDQVLADSLFALHESMNQ